MGNGPLFWPLFLFLSATVVAIFTFVGVTYFLASSSQERQARERFALMKTLAETPGENTQRVLDLLTEQDRRRARKARSEQLMGGLITIAVGVSLSVMLGSLAHDEPAMWTIGLIPGSIGAVIVVFTLLTKPEERSARSGS